MSKNMTFCLLCLVLMNGLSVACGDKTDDAEDTGLAEDTAPADDTESADSIDDVDGGDDAEVSDDGGSVDDSDSDAAGEVSIIQAVSAVNGGSVEAGDASIDIPPGALAEDTEITIREISSEGLPNEDLIASKVYEFGPDGTTFDAPVVLSIAYSASGGPEGATAMLAFLDGNSWITLADSVADGGEVTATSEHFTPFAVIWVVDGGGIVQVSGSCDEVDFVPCGGDITGTWDVALYCFSYDLLDGENGPFADCEGARIESNVDLEGTVTYDGDGGYAYDEMARYFGETVAPKECLGGPDVDCEVLADGISTIEDLGDTCRASWDYDDALVDVGTYSVQGNTLDTVRTEDGVEESVEYCVNGNVLTVRAYIEDADATVIVEHTRQ